jgi:hypothetical protein
MNGPDQKVFAGEIHAARFERRKQGECARKIVRRLFLFERNLVKKTIHCRLFNRNARIAYQNVRSGVKLAKNAAEKNTRLPPWRRYAKAPTRSPIVRVLSY